MPVHGDAKRPPGRPTHRNAKARFIVMHVYKPAGTSSEQQQKEVPQPSKEHYLRTKTRKVTLAGFGVMGSVLIGCHLSRGILVESNGCMLAGDPM